MWRLNLSTLSLCSTLVAAVVVSSACTDPSDVTQLHEEGPPMIAQVFMAEKVQVGTTTRIRNTALAFGDHPQIDSDPDSATFDDREVSSAVAFGAQQLRIVLDELVVGNAIEELACADGSFSRIPVGTDPDDIANCAGPDLSKCTGSNVVCVGPDGPVGILDEDEDGASDDFRMIDYGSGVLAVEILCDGQSMPLDPNLSFYNPSGNQQIPAATGVNGLGPAMVLVPRDGLKTSASCAVRFNDAVVDKDNQAVCAPEGGDFLTSNCSPGDTELVEWTVEPLTILGNDPSDGQADVPLTSGGGADASILLQFNAGISQDAAEAGIALTCGGTAVAIVPVVSADDKRIVTVTVTGGYPAGASCVLTVSTDVTDVFGGPLLQDLTVDFTTAPAA